MKVGGRSGTFWLSCLTRELMRSIPTTARAIVYCRIRSVRAFSLRTPHFQCHTSRVFSEPPQSTQNAADVRAKKVGRRNGKSEVCEGACE
eukprot:3937547-Rhodomonas_salina.3